MTFPSGFSQPKPTIRVVPIGAAVFILNLGADDPDVIVLEASGTAFSASVVNLPTSAAPGKEFQFSLVTHPTANPTLDVQYIDIFFPVTRGTVTSTSWRLFSGQRPTFIFGPTGWAADGGSGAAISGLNNRYDVSLGSGANGSLNGAAAGYNADGNSWGTAFGMSTNGSTSGAAVGRSANGSSYGAAVGRGANGSSYGAALGYAANGANYGAAFGYSANGASSGAALGNAANGSSYGAAVGRGANGASNGAAFGYSASTNSQDKAVALGYNSKAVRYRELVKNWDGGAPALQNWAVVGWYGDTATATPTELFLGGTASQRAILLANSAYQFEMQICAGVTAGGLTSSWRISGCIKTGATASTTALVGTPTVTMTGQDAGASGWTVAVSADTTNGSLNLVATGAASTTIRWNAHATLSELRF